MAKDEDLQPISFGSVSEAEMTKVYGFLREWLSEDRKSVSPRIALNQKPTKSFELPYRIERRWYEGDRLQYLFWSEKWVANRTSFSSDAGVNHLNVHPNDDVWEETVFRIDPHEGRVIQGVALGDDYLYWTETSPYPLDVPGWELFRKKTETGETVKIIDSSELDLLIFPTIHMCGNTLYIGFSYKEGYGEILQYDPDTDSFRHVFYRNCISHLYYCFDVYDRYLVTYEYDGETFYAVWYDTEEERGDLIRIPLKYPYEYPYHITPVGDWLVYSTSWNLTYAYHIKTGETRLIMPYSGDYAGIGERCLLLYPSKSFFVLYDLESDTWKKMTELSVDRGSGSGGFRWGILSEAENRAVIFETDRDTSPALVVTVRVSSPDS